MSGVQVPLCPPLLMEESDPTKKYIEALPDDQSEAVYTLEKTRIKKFGAKVRQLFGKSKDIPMAPVTDINEFRKSRQKVD
jgi:hypothetical protein